MLLPNATDQVVPTTLQQQFAIIVEGDGTVGTVDFFLDDEW